MLPARFKGSLQELDRPMVYRPVSQQLRLKRVWLRTERLLSHELKIKMLQFNPRFKASVSEHLTAHLLAAHHLPVSLARQR
jgi:hypothetical protein